MKHFKNKRVVIHNRETGLLVADTTILNYNSDKNTITIPSSSVNVPLEEKASILIFDDKCLYEYMGNPRSWSEDSELLVALYGEHEKDNRNFLRYRMEAQGAVVAVLINGQWIDLKRPITIGVKNISASGILFLAGSNDFEIGMRCKLKVDLKQGNQLTSEYEIVRTQNATKTTIEYGCKNIISDDSPDSKPAILSMGNNSGTDKEKNIIPSTGKYDLKTVSFEELTKAMELSCGYTDLVAQTAKMFETRDEKEADILVIMIERFVNSVSLAEIFNCINHRREKNEADYRHNLNVGILNAIMGQWLNYEVPDIRKLITAGISHTPDMMPQEDDTNSIVYTITRVSESYDVRASYPNQEYCGIPFAFLEHMIYSSDQSDYIYPELKKYLAEHILKALDHKQVLMTDRSIAEISFIPINDISHPLITLRKATIQANNPFMFRWIVVPIHGKEPEKEAKSDTEKAAASEAESKETANATAADGQEQKDNLSDATAGEEEITDQKEAGSEAGK